MSDIAFSEPVNLFPGIDGWEPFISVDSNDYLIAMTTAIFYSANNFTDTLIYRISMDHGASWFDEQMIYVDGVTFEADPVLFIDENDIMHFTFMLGWNIYYTRAQPMSTAVNGVVEWSDPIGVSGNDDSADKNWITGDPTGQHLYVTFNKGAPYAVESVDGGDTWSEPTMLVNDADRYYYSSGGVYLPGGTVLMSIDGVYEYNVTGDVVEPQVPSLATNPSIQILFRVFSTNSDATTWDNVIADASTQVDQNCPPWAECEHPTDFLIPSSSISSSGIKVYLLHTGNYDNVTHASTFIVKSTDNGSTWTVPMALSSSSGSTFAAFPFIAADDNNTVHVGWMDNRTSRWNFYHRFSSDGGDSWSVEVKINDNDGYEWQDDDGFLFPYGDYGRMIVDHQSNAHIVWGEGNGWYAYGGTFYARQGAVDEGSGGGSSEELSDADIGAIAGSIGGFALVSVGVALFWFKRKKAAANQAQGVSLLASQS